MKPASTSSSQIELEAIRARLVGTRGQQYWRSLEEVAQTREFQDLLHREFPTGASELTDDVSRRNFLKLMGASLALAGLTSCTRQPIQQIVPYVRQPEQIVPGQPLFFATALEHDGFATGLLVESHEGHPTKIEGNPDHPASLGATSIFDQASILGLYDPDRSQTVLDGGNISTWGAFLSAINSALEEQSPRHGAGIRILTETLTSPTLAAQIQAVLKKFPAAGWHQYQPISRDNVREGASLAFGEIVETHHHFEKARIILALDSDFLFTHPQRLLYARRFADGRRLTAGRKEMNRLYAVESTPTVTGSMADHRLPVNSGEVEGTARELVSKLEGRSHPNAFDDARSAWINAAVSDLQKNRGAGIVIVGERQPPIVHLLAHQINHSLGNVGETVSYSASAEAQPINQLQSLRQLVADMAAGRVDLLVILGGNPVFTAPCDIPFADALAKVKMCVHLGLEQDETSACSHWHIPQTHFLETWSDTRAFDGTVSIVQPLIEPLYQNRSAHEVLEAMLQQPVRTSYEIVREHWRQQKLWPDFEKSWRRALHDGIIAGTTLPSRQVQLKQAGSLPFEADPGRAAHTVEISFHPDPSIWDGRFANNGWLQELAKPVSKLTWDNAALIGPALAQKNDLANGDVVELRFQGRSLRLPVWITPGQAEHSVALHVGNGRTRVGSVGSSAGFDTFRLRCANALWFGSGLETTKTSEHYLLATTQEKHAVHGRDNLQNRDVLFTGTFATIPGRPRFC